MKKDKELEWNYKGYECWIIKMPVLGHRCGYTKVPKTHLANELNYDDVPIQVHGGLTWGGQGQFGFDCAHLDDTPEKWTLQAVKLEVEHMVDKLELLTWNEVIKAKLEYMPDWFRERVKINLL